jgi:DNA polymerase elongation subunit (family B)
MPRGWLLDITSSRRGDAVLLWLREEGGAAHRVEVPYLPTFLVTGATERRRTLGTELHARAEVAAVEEVRVRTSLFEPPDRRHDALAVTPAAHRFRAPLATEIDRCGGCVDYRLYDVDLATDQRYYIEHGLYPGAPVAWSGSEMVALEPVETLEPQRPPLSSAELAVSVVGRGPGRPRHPEDPVHSVKVGEVTLAFESEEETLRAAAREVARQDPDILWTQGGDRFDLPQLYRRALANGLTEAEFFLGREPRPFQLNRTGSSYVSYGRVYHQAPTFGLVGRLHLDWEERFVTDVSLEGFLDVARFSRIGLHVLTRRSPGTAFSAMEAVIVLADGGHIPWKKNFPERPKSARTLVDADRGGHIRAPPVGVFDGVDEFDFISLYPSIMVQHNLSIETLECACCPESPDRAPGLGYRSCMTRPLGVVPRTLDPILTRRLHFRTRKFETQGAERERYVRLCQAWKWVLVTSFGYQGYRNAKFGRIECHEAINAYAREALLALIALGRERGWETLHGIVDSVWMRPPAHADPLAFAEEVHVRLGLPLGYEGRYRWIVFLPDAAYGLGVPQRYYGRLEDGELKVRGIETRRGDTSSFVRVVQEEVLARAGEARTGAALTAMLPELLAKGRKHADELASGGVPSSELLLTLRVSQPLDEYRVASPAVAALLQLRAEGIERAPGESVSFLLVDHAARDFERKAVPVELLTGSEPYDVRAYVRLLARSFQTLFEPFGYPEERILAEWGYGEPPKPERARARRDYRSLERPGQRRLPDWEDTPAAAPEVV